MSGTVSLHIWKFDVWQYSGGRYVTRPALLPGQKGSHSKVGRVLCTGTPHGNKVVVEIEMDYADGGESERAGEVVWKAMKRRFPGRNLVPFRGQH